MPIQDFLATFRVDTATAEAQLTRFVQRVINADAQLNAALGRVGSGASATDINNLTSQTQRLVTALTSTGKAGTTAATGLKQAGAAARTTNLDFATLIRTRQQLEQRLADIRISSGGFNVGAGGAAERQVLRDLIANERAIQAFSQGYASATTRLRTFQNQLVQIPPSLARASQSQRDYTRLLQERVRLEDRLANIRIRSGGFNVGAGGVQERTVLRSLIENQEAIIRTGQGIAGANTRLATYRQQFASLPPVISAANAAIQRNVIALRQQAEHLERLRLGTLGPRELLSGFDQSLELMRQGLDRGSGDVQFFADRLNALPASFGHASREFIRHTTRIATGILIYDALGRAIQGVADEIDLITDIAREQIRFEAVVGDLGTEDQARFIRELGQVSVDTNTSMRDLVSQMDTVAGVTVSLGGAIDETAASLSLMRDIGQFTNITQRDMAQETETLLGLFSLTGDSVGQFSDRLGRITVAGQNNSRIISEITDGLSEAGRAASSAGFDFDVLTAILGEVTPKFLGALSGREIGGAITTFIGRLGDPAVVNKIEELSNGIIQVRDASGELRPASDVFLELATAINESVLSAEQGEKIVDAIVPPLNPGQRAVLNILIENVPNALKDLGPILEASARDARELSDNLVSGPAERFDRAIKQLQVSLLNTFSDDVINAVTNLANVVNFIAGIFDGAGGQALAFGIKLTVLALAIGGVSKALGLMRVLLFGSFLRNRAIQQAAAEAAAAATVSARGIGAHGAAVAAAGTAAGAAIAPTVGFTAALRGVAGAAALLLRALAPLLAIQAAIMALDFFNEVGRQAEQFSQQVSDAATAAGPAGIDELIRKMEELKAQGQSNTRDTILKGLFVDPNIQNDIERLKAIRNNLDLVGASLSDVQQRLDEVNNRDLGLFPGAEAQDILREEREILEGLVKALSEGGGRVTFAALAGGLAGATDASGEFVDGQAEVDEILRQIQVSLNEGSGAYQEFSDAETRAAAAAQITVELFDARAQAMSRYTNQLRDGRISLSDWEDAQRNVDAALEASANFVAAYGDRLDLIPGLQERVARTGEDAAQALFNLLLENPSTIDQQIGVIEQMIAVVEANEAAAQAVEENPITPRVNNAPMQNDTQNLRGFYEGLGGMHSETVNFFNTVRPTPQLNLSVLKAQLQEALRAYQLLSTLTGQQLNNIPEGVDDLGGRFGGGGGGFGTTPSAIQQRIDDLRRQIARLEKTTENVTDDQTDDLLRSLREQLQVLQGIKEGDKRLEDTLSRERQAPQTALVDVGDLSARQVEQAIRLARRLQNAIPGAGREAADETVALIRDARFLQFIRGLDSRFLTEAIQELTDVERRRLELEQQRLQDVTRSIVTRVGPIQSLVSAPVLAAGGGLLTGQGLNADPRLGNITINVPINWSGMSLRQLQNFIYKAISQAWIDAGRGG